MPVAVEEGPSEQRGAANSLQSSLSRDSPGGTRSAVAQCMPCPAADPAWLAAQLVARVAAQQSGADGSGHLQPTARGPACTEAQIVVPGSWPVMLRAEASGYLNWYAPKETGLLGVTGATGCAPGMPVEPGCAHSGSRSAPTQCAPEQRRAKQECQAPTRGGLAAGSGFQITIAPSRFDEEEFALYQK